jgi:hypothetical protein
VLAEDPFDEHAELSPHILAQRPVDRHIVAHGLDQLARDGAQRFVAEYLDRAVVCLERVVERELVLRQAERLAARVGLAQVLASAISSSITCAACTTGETISFSHSLVWIEVIFGQFYMPVVVAQIVGLKLAQALARDDGPRPKP